MSSQETLPLWIVGPSRSGKTTRLIEQFRQWATGGRGQFSRSQALVFTAIGDNRIELTRRLTTATQGAQPFYCTTPLGFFQDEVTLFWSLLIQQLGLRAQFPIRLSPETEQELAAYQWQAMLDRLEGQQAIDRPQLVRRLLDLLQLAALAGIPSQDIAGILNAGLAQPSASLPLPYEQVGELLQDWQQWCLDRGLLTYGLIVGLYGRYLLPNPVYQQHLVDRYNLMLADDVDEYPAIARELFQGLLAAGLNAAFTFNPDGAVRLGLGADPTALASLAEHCQIETLPPPPLGLATNYGADLVEFVTNPLAFLTLPEPFHAIQTISRADLLRQTAQTIVEGVQQGLVQPHQVAVIAPGLDAIARYAVSEILVKAGIAVEPLNDQRPLNSYPMIRALLTLLTLVYPGLGRLCDRDSVAELLIVLAGDRIDPVRAGLLADYCFAPHPEKPRLLPATTFPRWDRLGYQAAGAYDKILQWIATQQTQLEQRLIPNGVSLLDRAMQEFLVGSRTLPFEQLSALRQLMETAQHYWQVSDRLVALESTRLTPWQLSPEPVAAALASSAVSAMPTLQQDSFTTPLTAQPTVRRFIQLLQQGTVTANPYPVKPMGAASNAVTLATVFQYRSSRRAHRWQFWLDAGSPRWLSGVDALFAAPLFTQAWSGRTWSAEDTLSANEQRLRRIVLDLLGRVHIEHGKAINSRIYLCHSDLATNGQEQTGALLPLVNAIQ
jgi:hypothetical protein